MAVRPREPFGNMRFRLEIERMEEGGAVEAILPEARWDSTAGGRRSAHYGPLVLRRGVTRSREWFEWWNQARRAKPDPKRNVVVVLLDAEGEDVHHWHFARCEPLAYQLSPLHALGNLPLIETLELRVGGFTLE